MEAREYPIGMQSFEAIRRGQYVYVDKTSYIPALVRDGKYKFLSRPRRFGKSLLISMLEAYFRGKRELFKGLAIDRIRPEHWDEHVVVHFDLSGEDYGSADVLRKNLSGILDTYESELGIEPSDYSISYRFKRIAKELYERSGRGIVILIDEYDNPITSAIGNERLQDELRDILYGFFSSFKQLDTYISFCMLTGVTKYGKMSVFSGLNNLRDISFDDEFAGICGITEEELHGNFQPGVEKLAARLNMGVGEAYGLLKASYDGYHFSPEMLDVYNPFSIINALATSAIRNYWFDTATPTLLIKLLEYNDFDMRELNGGEASLSELGNISYNASDPKALFYQTGYLTIKGYDSEYDTYILGFPNKEVESGFMDNLLQAYTRDETMSVVRNMLRALRAGDPEEFINRLCAYLAGIPYDLRKNVSKYENYYHTIFYAIFSLLGVDVNAEYHTSQGSIDLIIRTKDFIYILELKINGTASDAMAQIHDRQYARQFATDGRRIILIGLGFSRKTNNIESRAIEWI